MLNNGICFQSVYIVCSYTDIRFGIDRLAVVIEDKTGSSPYVPGNLYLFCGRRFDCIKGLVREGLTVAPKRSVRMGLWDDFAQNREISDSCCYTAVPRTTGAAQAEGHSL